MKHTKKAGFTALLLALAMLASCAGSAAVGDETTTAQESQSDSVIETTEQPAIPELPDRDLGGFTLVLGKQPQDKIAWATISFAVAEENGEVLNDSIYRRNITMAEKYNFKLEDMVFTDPLVELTKQVMAGDTTCDAFLIPLNKVGTQVGEDTLVDFHEIPNIELDGEWWDQDMLRDLDIGGKQYFMNGDIIFSVYDCLRVIMYCKELAEDYGLSGFYELVDEGKWTHDKMLEMVELVSADLNSDGTRDYNDRFGVLYNASSFSSHIASRDVKLVDSKGNVGVFSEKFMDVYDNILSLFTREYSWDYNSDKYPGMTAREAIVTMFDNKQCLFFENGISAAAQYMRNVKNVDYGFLPSPKYDESQENYYSYVSTGAPILNIPVTVSSEDLEKVGFVLEALCRESNKTCVRTYFETCFSAKYTHDERSYDMILLATESRRYDVGGIYDLGGLMTTINTSLSAHDEAIASKLDAIRPAITEAYNKTIKG